MKTAKFQELNLSTEILKAVEELGFEEATPIQTQAIPHMLEGEDVVGQAQTGTGKTAAFGIPILEMVNPDDKQVQVLVLCPTRELAIQVAEELSRLGKYKRKIHVLPIYGGQSIERQIRGLKKGVQVVIGTPGRIMDHMNRRTLKLGGTRMIVLDEADEMLDMGFREDIEFILEAIPAKRQTVFFSATIPREIMDLTKKYQKKPQLVKVVHKELTVSGTEQIYFEIKERAKLEVLSRLLDMYNPKLSLIFCNTKRKVDELVTQLQTRGYFADALHGDMKQTQRDRVMNKFRSGTIDILVATDVAARGIDVDDVEAVFNYDVPQNPEYYVHRIGRTGRAGRTGHAFTFIVGKDIYKLKDIQKYAKAKITLHQVPSLSDVEESRTVLLLDKIKKVLDDNHLGKYRKYVEKLLADDYVAIDIAAALLKMVMANDRNEETLDDSVFQNTGAEPGMVRLFINVGKNQNIRPRDIVGSIAGETGISGKLIGSIDIYDRFTFVDVPHEYAHDVLTIMKNNQIKGNNINIEPAKKR